jgi:hypothetical protein
MAALGIKVRRYKVGAAWIGEKAGIHRSPRFSNVRLSSAYAARSA